MANRKLRKEKDLVYGMRKKLEVRQILKTAQRIVTAKLKVEKSIGV